MSLLRGYMHFFTTFIIWGLFSILLTSCATSPDSSSNSSDLGFNSNANFEQSFDHGTRAPASLTPPPIQENAEINPFFSRTQADYYFSLGEAYSNEGNVSKSIEAFKSVLIYDPQSTTVMIRLASEYVKNGMLTEAIDQALSAQKLDSKNTDIGLFLGGIYSGIKAYDKAIEQYEKTHTLNPNLAEPLIYLGAIYSEKDNFEQSIKYFSKVLKIKNYQNQHLPYYYLGRVFLEKGNLKEALTKFNASLKLKPDFTEAILALASLHVEMKKPEEAIKILVKFQKTKGPHPKVSEMLANLYIDSKQLDLAYQQLEVVESISDDPLNVKMKMAFLLIQKKMNTLAAQKLEEILTEVPESEKIHFYLAVVYADAKEYSKALEHFLKVPAHSSYYADAITQSAYIYKLSQKNDKAMDLIKKSLELRNDIPELYSLYAGLLDENQKYSQAHDLLKKAIEIFPENTQIHFYYGAISEKLGNTKNLISSMKKVLSLDPKHTQAMNYLAFTWAESNENLDEAETLAKNALTQEPKDGFIMDTLGWVYYKKRQFNLALKYTEAAFKVQNKVSVIAEHLGDIHLQLSSAEKAKHFYTKALELEEDSKRKQTLQDKITSIESPQSLSDRERQPASNK